MAVVVTAWLLSRGPLPLPILVPRIEAELGAVVQRAELAQQVRVGSVALEWHGLDHGLDVTVRDIRLLAADGSETARIGRVDVQPDIVALAGGHITMHRLAMTGPEIRLVRQPDGAISLGMPAWGSSAHRREEGDDPASASGSADDVAGATAEDPDPLAELLQTWGLLADLGLTLRDATLIFEDRSGGGFQGATPGLVRPWRLDISDLKFLHRNGTMVVEASADIPVHAVSSAEAPAVPRLDLALHAQGGTGEDALISAVVMAEGINPGRDLAGRLGLPALSGWRQPLEGVLTLDLDAGTLVTGDALGALSFAHLSLAGGAGTVALPTPKTHTWTPRRLSMDLTAERGETGVLSVSLLGFDLTLPDVSLTLAGDLRERPDGSLAGTLDAVMSGGLDVPTVVETWPAGVADGAREWIARNLSDGAVGESSLSLSLAGQGWDSLAVADVSGESPVSGMTVNFLDGLPPATGARGVVRYGPDAVTIALDGGGVGDLRVREGTIAFTDLDTGTELADMVFLIEGSLSDALALIDHQPLGYASRVGIDPAQADGAVDVTLGLAFPLLKDLPLDDLDVSVSATASGVGVPAVVLGQDLSGADVTLTLDTVGMDVTGRARLGGVPITLDWRENFSDGQDFDRRYTISGRVDNAARARFRLSGAPFQPPWLDGPVDATLTYTETGGQPARLRADVDLSPATLALDDLDWRKPADVPGRASVTGRFSEQAMTVDFDVTTAAAGSARGQARLDGTGELRGVSLDAVTLGQDTSLRVALEARSPAAGGGYRVDVSGPALDARPLLDGKEDSPAGVPASAAAGLDAPLPAAQADDDATPLDISVAVDRLRLTESVALMPVTVRALRDGRGQWREARIEGRIGAQGPPVSGRLAPDGAARTFAFHAGDAGAVAAALDITDQMRGGTLSLTGSLAPDDTARGVLEITDFRLDDAPVLARILAVAALTGILDELRGGGLSMARLSAPFHYANGVLRLDEARANGTALGLTANGDIDLERDRLDLSGVVVPIYVLNNVLGNIPLLGDLLVGEKGGGLFAVTYSAQGDLQDPRVSVNPLSVLTPGFLRGLFGLVPNQSNEEAARDAQTISDPDIPAYP